MVLGMVMEPSELPVLCPKDERGLAEPTWGLRFSLRAPARGQVSESVARHAAQQNATSNAVGTLRFANPAKLASSKNAEAGIVKK